MDGHKLRLWFSPVAPRFYAGQQVHREMELHKQLDRVADQESFLAFARALAKDRAAAVQMEIVTPASPYGPSAGGWENVSIESFLEAAVAWAEDRNFGSSQGLDTASPWKQFAVFLFSGRIYE